MVYSEASIGPIFIMEIDFVAFICKYRAHFKWASREHVIKVNFLGDDTTEVRATVVVASMEYCKRHYRVVAIFPISRC